MVHYLIGIINKLLLGVSREQECLEQQFSIAGAEVLRQCQLVFLLGIVGDQHTHIECLEADVYIRGELRMLLLDRNVSSKGASLE